MVALKSNSKCSCTYFRFLTVRRVHKLEAGLKTDTVYRKMVANSVPHAWTLHGPAAAGGGAGTMSVRQVGFNLIRS